MKVASWSPPATKSSISPAPSRVRSSRCGGARSATSRSSCARCRAFRRSTSSRKPCWPSPARPRAPRPPTCCARFNIPERLWNLPPGTFSGGEQQRVNLARGLLAEHPILLLDEPTASLDADNRAVVVDIVKERKARGAAIVAIVHDDSVREAIADASVDVAQFAMAA